MSFRPPSQNTKNFLDQASRAYEASLNGTDASLYLMNRGIQTETAQYFRLGIVTEENHSPGHEQYIGRLTIPYITHTGIVQIRFRAVPTGGILGNPEPSPKYLSEGGGGVTIYNTRDLASYDLLAICEGEIDTMTAHQSGIMAVGIPGAKNWQKLFSRAMKFRKVVIFADNDDSGEGLELAKAIQKDISGSRVILMPKRHDVNSFVREHGAEALREKAGLK